ncbi:MAG: EscN/YscN/HrcN family type III secretion system ATPase [Verrucomicrobia bacterium 21-51-4]|nr:MAG: EscN/YscN/HrcN family type III secretion system ATPase [Verrucomicrobia bacterium 21-51-4]
MIESEGPDVSIGSVCEIHSLSANRRAMAEVVGFRDNRVLLMPLEAFYDIYPGAPVTVAARMSGVPVGDELLGRIIDGLGRPIDGHGPLGASIENRLHSEAPSPMDRPVIAEALQTGVRAIDSFIPIGCGQRVGIFAGSGVGKSTLLSMMTRGTNADINVVALVGERGRELREFVECDLGKDGMKKTVIIASTSDQPAPLRLRAAWMAIAVAEYFRDQGQKVLFMMDSLTRLAMAQREVGLSVGEPPTTRGYTPSVFSLLPRLVERAGMGVRGSITGVYTVLVEGDDLNEPVADAVRGLLDGHIVLKRSLAVANHYPPIDVLESVSRLARHICSREDLECVGRARELLAIYRKHEDLISIGAYVPKTNPKVDQAIAGHDNINDFLKQPFDVLYDRASTWAELRTVLQ